MHCDRRHIVLPVLLLTLACGGSDANDDGNPPPASNTISVRNMPEGFVPSALTITAGDSVRFVWASASTNHNLVSALGNPAALPESPGSPLLLNDPQDFHVVFPAAGSYGFFCSAHGANPSAGSLSGMAGTITVQ
jgi:plastocyanin